MPMPNFMKRAQCAVDESWRAFAKPATTKPAATPAAPNLGPAITFGALDIFLGRVRRRDQRIGVQQPAVMRFDRGTGDVPCVIRDLSPGGVGLSVAADIDVPDRFI